MKLASVEKIISVTHHDNADALDIVKVLGYECIVQRGTHREGEEVILIQPDTILPDAPWSETFKARSSRVKACKLRGRWSFGIVMPIFGLIPAVIVDTLNVGDEVSHLIGVTKYEPPLPKDLQAAGYLPNGLPKTDEERWQNIDNIPFGSMCDITLKYDGSSLTVFARKNEDGEWETSICSRSLCLKDDCQNQYTIAAEKYDLVKKLLDYCQKHDVSLALRGELYGSGIQGHGKNPHSKLPLGFAAYNIYNMDTFKYESHNTPHHYTKVCDELGIETVKILEKDVVFTEEHIRKYSVDIDEIDGKSYEGVVVKFHNGGSFKIINLKYDEKK